MKTNIIIPGALRQYTDNKDMLELSGNSVAEVLKELTEQYPAVKKHLFAEGGDLRNFVNIYINEDDIRSKQHIDTLINEGDVISIVPSVAGGKIASNTVEEVDLSSEEIRRYSRHILMPELGVEGQKKIKQASVLLVGLGGLGSPLAMYLAAAGIGRIGLVDNDVVDETNLQRQVIYSYDQVGKSKLISAKERLQGINPHIRIDTYETFLTSDNAIEICTPYDMIIDGTDNFSTRYLVNDVCVLLGKPNIHGSIFRFDGQVSVFDAKEGPCYRCLYPEPPPPGMVPSCAEGGVLGILPGIIGMIQATEAIKLALGTGDLLIGRLLIYDALRMKFRELKLNKDPQCPICGDNPQIKKLIDYDAFCGVVHDVEDILEPEWNITPLELKNDLDLGKKIRVLDVRQPQEYAISRLPESELIPLSNLDVNLHGLDREEEIVVMCRSGVRSAQAVKFLREAGFQKVKNLQGILISSLVKLLNLSFPRRRESITFFVGEKIHNPLKVS
jgi:adenylyltransferase/sulfurtransferase